MNLFHNLVFFEIGRDEGFQAGYLCHIFVHYFVSAELDAFEGAFSE